MGLKITKVKSIGLKKYYEFVFLNFSFIYIYIYIYMINYVKLNGRTINYPNILDC